LSAIASTELQSLPDIEYDYLRERILSGELDFGAALRQEEIAAQLGFRHQG